MLQGVFELLTRQDQEITLEDHIEIFKQRALEEADEPAPEAVRVSEPKERAMTVTELTEGLGLIDTAIKMFVDIDCKGKVMPGADIIRVP